MKRFEDDFEKYLNLYLDGFLDDAEASEFEKYLAKNPEKAAEFEDYKTLNFTAKGDLLPDLPEGYWEGLESRIKRRVAGLPETRGFWERFSQRFFSFNRTIKVAATALTLITIFLISKQFIGGTKITQMAESQQVGTISKPEIRGGRSGDVESMMKGEMEQGMVADTLGHDSLAEGIEPEAEKPQTQQHDNILMRENEIADEVQISPPAEAEESIPAPSFELQKPSFEKQSTDKIQTYGDTKQEIELQSVMGKEQAESVTEDQNTPKVHKNEYKNVATAEEQPAIPKAQAQADAIADSISDVGHGMALPDSMKSKSDKARAIAKKDLLNEPMGEKGQVATMSASESIRVATPSKLDDFPYIPEDEYSFTSPAPEENITGEFDESLKDYVADSLQERQNLLRLEGDSLIQAYNIAVNPVKKLNLFQQIIKKYLVIIQESKSEPDAEKCQNLLKLGFQNNIILYPEYNSYQDSLKNLIREKK